MPGGLELLADHGVPGPGAAQLGADELLGVAVGVRDGRQVGLGLDPEVGGGEARRRQVIHLVGDHVRQAEIVVVTGHDEGRYRSDAGYVPKRAPSWAICDLIDHSGIA